VSGVSGNLMEISIEFFVRKFDENFDKIINFEGIFEICKV
jgi:hypothetical protein